MMTPRTKAAIARSRATANPSYKKEASDKRFDNSFVQSEAENLKNKISQLLDINLAELLLDESENNGFDLAEYDKDLIISIARKIPIGLQVEVLGCVSDIYARYRYIKKK